MLMRMVRQNVPARGRSDLGMPCIRDRVAQTSAMLVPSPIFEADLRPEQYAYRPGRSTNDAVRRVHGLWAALKRSYHGTYHHFSPKHLDGVLPIPALWVLNVANIDSCIDER